MGTRTRSLLAGAFVLAMLWIGMPGFSGATFTSSTTNSSRVAAAYDWTPPTVSMTAPSGPLSGTATLTATATDARSTISSVVVQYLAAGGAWTTACTSTSSPYTCSWSTTSVLDGGYELRANATDSWGNSATSATVSATVANQATVTLTPPGDIVRGAVPLHASLVNPGGLAVTDFHLEVSVVDANSWTTISGCTSTTLTLSCSWSPSTNSYDLRAVAVVGGTTVRDLVTDVLVDNAGPSVTVTNPGSTLSGTVTLAATATDADAGVASVDLQYGATGGTSWTTACSISAAPYTCRFDTTRIADGSYDLRAVATDYAGNTTISTTLKKVTVNNSVASVSVEDPGAYVGGTVTVNANANSSNGVANVSVQRAVHGSGAFVEICSDTSSPYSCAWDTTTLTDGQYDLRAVLTDGRGIVLSSTGTVTVNVDNSPLKAYDVQGVNRGNFVGRIEAGDQIVFTYTGVVDPATLVAGWDGRARSVTARIKDGQLITAGTTTDDTFSVDGVNLGEANLHGNYVKKRKTVTFASTMTAAATTVAGNAATVVTVTFGSPSMGVSTTPAIGAIAWSPSSAAKNVAGTACSLAVAIESGLGDKDF